MPVYLSVFPRIKIIEFFGLGVYIGATLTPTGCSNLSSISVSFPGRWRESQWNAKPNKMSKDFERRLLSYYKFYTPFILSKPAETLSDAD